MRSRTVAYALLVAVSLGLATCAPPARSDRMAPGPTGETQFAADSPLREAVELKDVGGGEPATEDTSIGDVQLRQAVRNSLEQYGLLQADDAKARFRLNVTMVRLSPPGAGIDLTVNSQIWYTLARADTGAVLFNDVVKASYTAKLGDEFVALLRQRLAKEGAIRANIAAFLERLKSLPVSGPAKQSAELAQ
ncbi:MAG TPA: hypothetical protein VJN67_17450 [Stellaceae bacterium]|nr:hypothetical protein [Stellaceae bacterium]